MPSQKTSFSTQPYKGTRDFYPKESIIDWSDKIHSKQKHNYYFEILSKTLKSYGFCEYSSSIIEDAEVFVAKSGDELGSEQLYKFQDKGNRAIALRPELTLSVARMVAGQFENLRFPLRWFCSDNCFRYERPQKGRSREFWQTEINIIGAEAGGVDLEMLILTVELFKAFGAKPNMFKIMFNHRGVLDKWIEQNDWQSQKSIIFKVLDNWFKLDENTRRLELSKTLNSNDCDKIIATVHKQGPEWQEYLNIAFEFEELNLIINNLSKIYPNYVLEFTPAIIRGQAYYTGLIFEAFDTNPSNNRSLFGGGRFDDLLGLYDKKALAVGCAPGDVSMNEFLEGWDLYPKYFEEVTKIGIILTSNYSADELYSKIIPDLKAQNKRWDIDYSWDRSQKKRIETLKKRGCTEILIIDSNK